MCSSFFSTIKFVLVALLIVSIASQSASACSWGYLIWQNRYRNSDPLYRFVQNGKVGYIDQAGKILIPPTLKTFGNTDYGFRDGLLNLAGSGGQFIDAKGELVIDQKYESIGGFSEGLAQVSFDWFKKWGYIDKTGKIVIDARFDYRPGDFSEGLAAASINGKVGYIDRSGKYVIQPAFLDGDEFQEGIARVVAEGPCSIPPSGPCGVRRNVGVDYQVPILPACQYTYIDKRGRVLTDTRFQVARNFSEGLAPVRVGQLWGYLNQQGHIALNFQFDGAEPFSDGLALVKQDGLYGYIDHQGVFVISPTFRLASGFSDGLALVGGEWDKQTNSYNPYFYIDKSGKPAFKEQFAMASGFFKGLAHVKLLETRPGTSSQTKSLQPEFAWINTEGKKVFTYRAQ